MEGLPHLEYEYAVDRGKPLFACVINETALDAKVAAESKSVLELEEPKKYKEFKELVQSKLVKFWDDKKDIKIMVSETLAQLSRGENLIGWVRADTTVDMSALTVELARLSSENAQLRESTQNPNADELFNYSTV